MRPRGQLWLPCLAPGPASSMPRGGPAVEIDADVSEGASGIPSLLREAGARVRILRLPGFGCLVRNDERP